MYFWAIISAVLGPLSDRFFFQGGGPSPFSFFRVIFRIEKVGRRGLSYHEAQYDHGFLCYVEVWTDQRSWLASAHFMTSCFLFLCKCCHYWSAKSGLFQVKKNKDASQIAWSHTTCSWSRVSGCTARCHHPVEIVPEGLRHPEIIVEGFARVPLPLALQQKISKSMLSLTGVIMPNAVSKLCSFEELTVSLNPVHPQFHQRGSKNGQYFF